MARHSGERLVEDYDFESVKLNPTSIKNRICKSPTAGHCYTLLNTGKSDCPSSLVDFDWQQFYRVSVKVLSQPYLEKPVVERGGFYMQNMCSTTKF